MSSPAPPTDRADAGLLHHLPHSPPESPESSAPPPASSHRTAVLTWEDVSYTVSGADEGDTRILVRHVSGYVQSGEMLAVLGPSGAGKTTLLDILAQRKVKSKGDITGRIMLNGEPVEPAAFQLCSGYVQQEDIMHSYVTVEEVVRFSATLRTSPTISEEVLESRVSQVLRQLGIYHVRHSCIGSALVRGISGGERKRCAVAAEMVTLPSLLFLDEPTTGLDTFTALHLLTLLRSLSRSGVAVVFSIHQPRSRIYEAFDRVLLLNGFGEEAYFGPAADAVQFLAEIGLSSGCSSNPADYLIDAVSVSPVEEAWLSEEAQQSAAVEAATDGNQLRLPSPAPTQGRDIAAAFASLRLADVMRQIDELQRSSRAATAALAETGSPVRAYPRSWTTQVRCIAMRCLRNRRRDPVATYVSVTSAIVFAFLTGTIYYQVGNSQDSIRSRMGVLFFIMMISTFSSLGSLEMFLTDRAIYAREHRNGMYSTSAYYVGKFIQDAPIVVAINFLFNLIVYLLVGLQGTVAKFLIFDSVGALVTLNSYALCLLMSNLSKDYATGNIITSLLLVLYLLPTGGMLVSLNSIPFMWRWIKHISFARFAFSVMVANEFDGLTFVCDPVPSDIAPCITSGTTYAASQGMYAKDIRSHMLVVALSMAVYLVLGYLALRGWRSTEGK
ncbi:putative ATP-binding cassette protein subfamily G,member 6 [Leishmania major strain Friedlin]|uniref:Putative ATP-binding cassette protein subfamily G,member 6 n=1 Tax=Leishmania major TaxID=5664 RepID=Q4Q1D0_LEIMA|nr:putative ATP-binding cassette protein subfamily G,member 6 [Leishmania major strain Friedlin]CAG9583824.1 ATP-binding_cassette_protein_subfamily_G_-_member_6_-_putative [Leishmania major strain Friedlin]CAJ09251.1 putative ATP-binding cassette protein subfamily G,member 6 [Leishmania major strain Friedlin]|eukprot:XP_001686868.1 putative ATP-binding cassette protein subfamily G,member 6 [Leishmania major strain Friedlin]